MQTIVPYFKSAQALIRPLLFRLCLLIPFPHFIVRFFVYTFFSCFIHSFFTTLLSVPGFFRLVFFRLFRNFSIIYFRSLFFSSFAYSGANIRGLDLLLDLPQLGTWARLITDRLGTRDSGSTHHSDRLETRGSIMAQSSVLGLSSSQIGSGLHAHFKLGSARLGDRLEAQLELEIRRGPKFDLHLYLSSRHDKFWFDFRLDFRGSARLMARSSAELGSTQPRPDSNWLRRFVNQIRTHCPNCILGLGSARLEAYFFFTLEVLLGTVQVSDRFGLGSRRPRLTFRLGYRLGVRL